MSLPAMRVRHIGGVAVVGVGPHAAGDPLSDDGLPGVCRATPRVVVDLIGAEPISSAFLGHLIRAVQVARTTDHRLRLCCPASVAREVLVGINVHRLIPTYPTLAAALADF